LPLTILEAMASSLPVIATPVGGIPDLVEDGENGFIVPVGDSSMLAEKTICLMSKPVLRKKMGKNNVSKIAENYNPIVISRLYSVIYNQMIQGTPNAD
jgi:glycosyltransferase involved in cell wall biosynthesis